MERPLTLRVAYAELLRLHAENRELRAENSRLRLDNEYLASRGFAELAISEKELVKAGLKKCGLIKGGKKDESEGRDRE